MWNVVHNTILPFGFGIQIRVSICIRVQQCKWAITLLYPLQSVLRVIGQCEHTTEVSEHNPIVTPIPCGSFKWVQNPFLTYSCTNAVPFHWNELEQTLELQSESNGMHEKSIIILFMCQNSFCYVRKHYWSNFQRRSSYFILIPPLSL